MKMLLVYSLFSSALATTVVTGSEACSASGHPETGGFYITGFGEKADETPDVPVLDARGRPCSEHPKSLTCDTAHHNYILAHEDEDDPSSFGDTGQRADDTLWEKNPEKPYPNALPKPCTVNEMWGTYCEDIALTHSFMTPMTCSIMRFSYPADSGSTVFKMKDNSSFQACDFTDAEQIDEAGTLPSGMKHVDYPFDYDSADTTAYFASQNGCDEGQKVAIRITGGTRDGAREYMSTYDACFTMGVDDRQGRIKNCDCDGSKYRMAGQNEVCHTGYVNGCRYNSPDDDSCCNPDTVAETGITVWGTIGFSHYTKAGNCIPKNKKQDMLQSAGDLYHMCGSGADPANQTLLDKCELFKTGACPWWRRYSNPAMGSYGGYDYNTLTDSFDGALSVYEPLCEPWYEIANCKDLEDGKQLGADLICAANSACADVNMTAALIELKEEITPDTCRGSQMVAAYKMYLADITAAPTPEPTPKPTTPATPAPTTAPTTPKPTPKAVTDTESSTALAAIGLTLAVLA
jgi:hypothetical protein